LPNTRLAQERDADSIWRILEPVLRAGETYALPRDWSRDEALAFWFLAGHEVFVAEDEGNVVGTHYLQANQRGGGAHVANCGYVTATDAAGRGVATAMCLHSLEHAAKRGFRAMQFNLVLSSNTRAVTLWQRLGFDIVGTIPAACDHPRLGLVDAFVMYRKL
jgi:ribosomal protein S18 acetylase RimI-like enzyme